ncbi:hypothetical protein RJ640_025643 [Escallonia rubra]|uniref:Protein kinase domain-containing protein n=1 Tax=Escallonia rubra TaxID=112253 RepID=A0AA88RRK3_9ASTE|nr:hypothetical protein RJ640_025643 [Escallonia rubra]
MGCVSSRQARSSASPVFDYSATVRDNGSSTNSDSTLPVKGGFGTLEKIKEEPETEKEEESVHRNPKPPAKKGGSEKKLAFSFKFGRLTDGEHVAAGWPAWLSAVAGEAIEGWLPLRSDTFERLEKIGQGTYSSVYRARDVETGRMVALKKVRFDNFQPESVRFMAREITVLRRLDHPNLMKLEGIITSRLSCSVYLVFEYMEHDLSGLLSCPDIKFTDAQIKCYMRQLLYGVEHCHSRGVIHRDIKASNILVNNEGILKIADFGLATYLNPRNKQPLTSRVVTLWYRPPELLLGATNYGASVDMWSVGCVFAELFIGRPILKGRTEVEQLHKIFKLCGTPPEEHWRKSKLPLAAMFKPQHPYESTLRERCKEFPKTAVNLIETFLSIEPDKRGTASSALDSEYFNTKPYACDPSSLPKYPANKEIDAKFREEARRVENGYNSVKDSEKSLGCFRLKSTWELISGKREVEANIQVGRRNIGGNAPYSRGKGGTESRGSGKSSYDTMSEASQGTEISQDDSIRSVPVHITASSGFAWAKRRKQNAASSRLNSQATSRSQNLRTLDPSSVLHANDTLDSERDEHDDFSSRNPAASSGHDEIARRAMHRHRSHPNRPDSFDSSNLFQPEELSVDYNDQRERLPFSGPLLSQKRRTDGRQESHIRQAAARRSRFYKGMALNPLIQANAASIFCSQLLFDISDAAYQRL